MIQLKDPALIIFASDFMMETAYMTEAETGMYMKVLCNINFHGHLTYEQIKMICKDRTSTIIGSLAMDDEGKYYHVRSEYEAIKRAEYKKSRAKNAAGKRVRARAPKEDNTANTPEQMKMENEANWENQSEQEVKKAYGKHRNVFLTDKEYEMLKSETEGDLNELIETFSLHNKAKDYGYKSHYAALRLWDMKNHPNGEKSFGAFERMCAEDIEYSK